MNFQPFVGSSQVTAVNSFSPIHRRHHQNSKKNALCGLGYRKCLPAGAEKFKSCKISEIDAVIKAFFLKIPNFFHLSGMFSIVEAKVVPENEPVFRYASHNIVIRIDFLRRKCSMNLSLQRSSENEKWKMG
jgi:hypothetical protein